MICVAIKHFDNFDDLLSVDNDIDNYEEVLQNTYNYQIIKNNVSIKCSKKELKKFLIFCRQKVLTENDDDDDIQLTKDGIIVTFSGHGTHDAFYCSNNEKFYYSDIRAIFTADEHLCTIPKIFLVDACRIYNDGNNDDNDNNKRNTVDTQVTKFCGTLMATSEGQTIRGGNVSRCICKQLKIIYNNNINIDKENRSWRSFRKIRKLASDYLKKDKINQKMVVTEHEDEIDDVVLLPRDENAKNLGIIMLFFFLCFFILHLL